MPDLPDLFRSLDGLDVPDIEERARQLGPRPPTEPEGPSRLRRAGIVAVALLVAVVGIGFALRAFPPGGRVGGSSPSSTRASEELIALSIQHGPLSGAPLTRLTDLALVRRDGSHVRRLTGFPTDLDPDPWVARYGFSSDDSPAFSPDGRTIAFIRRYSEGVDSLCEIGVDGTGFRIVVRDLRGAELAWSPDGSRFAFYSENDGGIHVMDADGTNEHAVTPRRDGQPNQDSPTWTPDSRRLYFVSGHRVYAVHPDGSGLSVAVALPRAAISVADSPDGSTLAVVQAEPTHGHQAYAQAVWLAEADGSNLHRLTPRGDAFGFSATWSPDGARLLMSGPGEHLWLIDRDGRHFHRFHGVDGNAPVAWWGPRT